VKTPEIWIQTVSGARLDCAHLERNTYDAMDLAQGLSSQTRFAGQYRSDYTWSVLHHSWLVRLIVDILYDEDGFSYKVWRVARLVALLHDGSEAFLGDLPTPFKRVLPEFVAYEHRMQYEIYRQYGLTDDDLSHSKEIVKSADTSAMLVEARVLGIPTENWGFEARVTDQMVDRFHLVEKYSINDLTSLFCMEANHGRYDLNTRELT